MPENYLTDEHVKVATFSSRAEAEIAKGILEANGIPVSVYGYSSERPHLNFTGGVNVSVPPDQVASAEALLRASFDGTLSQGPSWVCEVCGERCESQFTQCWRCGAVRPS